MTHKMEFKLNFTDIFKLNFLNYWLIDFSKNFTEGRGVDCLSMYKFQEKLNYEKKVTELFFEIILGALNLRGDPEPAKV